MVARSTFAGDWARNVSTSGIISTPVLPAGSHCDQQFRHKRRVIMGTIKDALEYAVGKLAHEEQKSALLDAQVLLGHVLDVNRVTLYTYPGRALSPELERQFFQLIERRGR